MRFSNLSEVLQLVERSLKFSSGTRGSCDLGPAGLSDLICQESRPHSCQPPGPYLVASSRLPNLFLPQGLCASQLQYPENPRILAVLWAASSDVTFDLGFTVVPWVYIPVFSIVCLFSTSPPIPPSSYYQTSLAPLECNSLVPRAPSFLFHTAESPTA